jgi:hypothetical protein
MPKYLPDTPYSDDFFKIHSQIAETIYGIIKSEDISKHSFTLGIFGRWGSGKSLVIKELKEDIREKKDNEIILIEFDVWKYIDDSLYRNILFDFEKQLHNHSNTKIKDKFLNGYISSKEKESLQQILNYSREHSFANQNKDTNKSKNILQKPFKYVREKWQLLIIIFIGLVIGGVIYTYKDLLKHEISAPLYSVLRIFFLFAVCVGFIELLKEFFKDFFKEMLPKSNIILQSTSPTFAQDQFEGIFQDFIGQLLRIEKKGKVVIVFDNLDRCEPDVTLKALAGLKTFMNLSNCFYLIPCDELEIKKHLGSMVGNIDSETGVLDKIFQAYLRIPIIPEDIKFRFIDECLKQAEFDLKPEEKAKIVQILTYAYSGDTPRQIKRFFNDFISYYKLALTIDTEKKFLLDNIVMFTFMMTIKQKWPEVERKIVDYPSLFVEYFNDKSKDRIGHKLSDFKRYLDTCISWVDLQKNPLDYIYLKEVKQSGLIIQQTLRNEYDKFEITESSVKEIDSVLNEYIGNQYWKFFENGIDKVSQILSDEINKKKNEHLIKLLFECYWNNIYKFDNNTLKGKEFNSIVLRHSQFFINNIDLINTLNTNSIPTAQRHCIDIVYSEGYNEITSKLFSAFLRSFKPELLQDFFIVHNSSETLKNQKFLELVDAQDSAKFISLQYFTQVTNVINLNEYPNETLNLLKRFKGTDLYNQIAPIIANKISDLLSTFASHNHLHIYDTNVIELLDLITQDDIRDGTKQRLSDALTLRILRLFGNNHIDMGVNYSIKALLLVNEGNKIQELKTSIQQITNPRYIGYRNNFIPFMNRIKTTDLEKILKSNTYNHELFIAIGYHNLSDIFYQKISAEFIKDIITNHKIITVLSANYGSEKQNIDITSRIQEYTSRGINQGIVTFSTFQISDPAPGIVKQLKIHCRINGKETELSWNDGQQYFIG